MTPTTGIYIPGPAILQGAAHVFFGNQWHAVNKGKFDPDENGQRRRVVIVDNFEIKTQLKAMLTSDHFAEEMLAKTSQFREKIKKISDAVITSQEFHQQQKLELKSLCVEVMSVGPKYDSMQTFKPDPNARLKQVASAVVGAAAGGLLGAVASSAYSCTPATTTTVACSSALLGGGLGSAFGKHEFPPVVGTELSCDQLATRIIERSLMCSTIKVLSYYSGNPSETSLSLAESLASSLNRQSAKFAQTVYGYQGKAGLQPVDNHATRRVDGNKLVRQRDVRVEHKVWG